MLEMEKHKYHMALQDLTLTTLLDTEGYFEKF